MPKIESEGHEGDKDMDSVAALRYRAWPSGATEAVARSGNGILKGGTRAQRWVQFQQ